MFNSKALKPRKYRWQYEDEDKTFFQNLAYLFKKYLIWPVKDKYRRTKERSKRAFDYAVFGWHNHDWDIAYVYHLLEFKLKRLQKCLDGGFAIQETEDMAALADLIEIVARLGKSDYETKYMDEHDLKWGQIESRTEPYKYDKNGEVLTYSWISWRKNCPEDASQEVKDLERKENKACYDAGEADRIRDIERIAEILRVNGPRFWD